MDNESGFSRIERAINQLGSFSWNLQFIAEDQADKLAILNEALKNKIQSATGNGKKIVSGFSYWGVGPTLAWESACNSNFYIVMKQSIDSFAHRWRSLLAGDDNSLTRENYHYVSLGVGTGEKDSVIVNYFRQRSDLFYYFPVDMSPEMIRVGVRKVSSENRELEMRRVLPIQLDFSIRKNIKHLRRLLDNITGDEPVLFSLLGNTLANFDGDEELLTRIQRYLIRENDRFLIEVASTNRLDRLASNYARMEYESSDDYKRFVTSAILHNTDLTIDMNNVCVDTSIEEERALFIKVYYLNRGEDIQVTLPNRTSMTLQQDDSIRLQVSRKYHDTGIETVVQNSGFEIIKNQNEFFESNTQEFNDVFGMNLLLLKKCGNREITIDEERFSIAVSFAGEDRDYVSTIISELEKYEPNKIFYDLNHQGELARPDLDTHLQQIYSNDSELIVVFLSEHYRRKNWCNTEWRAIRNVLHNQERHKVMYIRMDDVEIEGVDAIDGYIDTRVADTNNIVSGILDRLEYNRTSKE